MGGYVPQSADGEIEAENGNGFVKVRVRHHSSLVVGQNNIAPERPYKSGVERALATSYAE